MGANAEDLTRKLRSIKIAQERLTETWLIEQAVYPGHVDSLFRLVVELYGMTDRKPAFDGHKVVSCAAMDDFTKVLSKADDALQDEHLVGGQWHLEQLVGAGWKLTDAADKSEAVR